MSSYLKDVVTADVTEFGIDNFPIENYGIQYKPAKHQLPIGFICNLLVVVKYLGRDKFSAKKYLCKCECGNYVICNQSKLESHHRKSCGEATHAEHKHDLSDSRLYSIWSTCKTRCTNINHPTAKNYACRGIKMCDYWMQDFKMFYNWAVTHGYADDLTLDRIDNNGDYTPQNCRWVTPLEQAHNRRNTLIVNGLSCRQIINALGEAYTKKRRLDVWYSMEHCPEFFQTF